MTYYDQMLDAVANRDRSTCWEPMGTQINKFGHHSIRREGKGPHCGLHALSLEAATGGRPPGAFACHRQICSGPWCWNPDHLYWGDAATNGRDVAEWGHSLRGERNGRAKVTEHQVRAIRARHRSGGITVAALAREFDLSPSAMHSLVSGKNWKHVA